MSVTLVTLVLLIGVTRARVRSICEYASQASQRGVVNLKPDVLSRRIFPDIAA